MDVSLLKAFIEIAKTSSFSRAAEQLHITQPAVSKRIAQLENQLGERLIDRIGRKVTLTQAGNTLLPHAHSIINQLEDTRRSLNNLSGRISGKLNLGISHHLGLHRLPSVLQDFVEEYPAVSLDIEFLDSEVAYEGVLNGQIELGIITLAQQVSDKIHALPVWDDPLRFVVSPNHPLSSLSKVDLSDLARHKAILPKMNTFTGNLVKHLFDTHGLSLTASNSTNYLESIKMMVSIGLGWSLLPETLIDEQLIQLNVGNIHLERQLGAIYHTERTLSNAANTLLVKLKRISNGI